MKPYKPKPGTDILPPRWSDMGIQGQSINGPRFNPVAAKQDIIPAMINPSEHRILKAVGGAGVQNPRTGMMHYYNDPMGDSSDPESSNYGGGMGEDRGSMDTASRNYAAMGEALSPSYSGSIPKGAVQYNFEEPNRFKQWLGKTAGTIGGNIIGSTFGGPIVGKGAGTLLGNLGGKWGQGGWNSSAYGDTGPNWQGGAESKVGGGGTSLGTGIYGGMGASGGLAGGVGGGAGSAGGTSGGTSGGVYPSVYTDPVTGRLLYQSQSVGNLGNQAFSDQQLIDSLMGTSVGKQNVQQQIGNLQSTIASMKAAGADTSFYERELQRLQGLGGQELSADNPLLAYVNSGLNERVMNEQLDNTVANQLRSSDEQMARRGLGSLGSPMQDQLRASLGLSTAQARNQNKLSAQEEAFNNRMELLNYLKQSQGQDYQQDMGRTGIGMTLGDWENQRKIAEITRKDQKSMYNQNLDFMKDQADDQYWSSILSGVGQGLGSVDWGSLF